MRKSSSNSRGKFPGTMPLVVLVAQASDGHWRVFGSRLRSYADGKCGLFIAQSLHGSTEEARRAGTKQARAAATMSKSVYAGQDERIARTLHHPLPGELSKAMQSRRPTAAHRPHSQRRRHDDPKYVGRFRAEGMRMPNSFVRVATP